MRLKKNLEDYKDQMQLMLSSFQAMRELTRTIYLNKMFHQGKENIIINIIIVPTGMQAEFSAF